MSPGEALARTLLLMRQNLREDVSEQTLLQALTSVRVEFVADEHNLETPEGQYALTTASLLTARTGATCLLRFPNVPLLGVQTPLQGPQLMDALLEVGLDLIPDRAMSAHVPARAPDLAIVLGDAPYYGGARWVVRISGDAWEGRLSPIGLRWTSVNSPFGALAAAGLAAGEAYKLAMRRLQDHAANGPFDRFFEATQTASVALAPTGTPPPTAALGYFDMISGGAITNAALYALARIPGVQGNVRVIEHDDNEMTNLNRYALLRRSGVGQKKAPYLAELDLGHLELKAITARYEGVRSWAHESLAPAVLVGVDNLQARWAAQEAGPEWLGIGATEGYLAQSTVHYSRLPCALCVHRGDPAEANEELPTAAFISHWAGLAVAAGYVLEKSGSGLSADEQITEIDCLQPGNSRSFRRIGAIAREGCPNGCMQAP